MASNTDSHLSVLMRDSSRARPKRSLAAYFLAALIAVFALGGVAPAAHALSCDVTYDPISNIPPAQLTISAPGTYCFNAGTYNTQITIISSDVTLQPTTSSMAVTIQPTSLVQNSADPDTSTPQYDIILVGGGVASITGVTISDLVVDGSLASSTFSGCADDYNGVLFLNAVGTITGSTVQNIYLPLADAGCQPGLGIEVQTATGLYSQVTISNDKVLNYNKNGITCKDAGTDCDITGNTVSFYTPYAPYIAPNGIELSFGATGTITGNAVSGNVCADAAANCLDSDMITTGGPGTGILTYETTGAVTISENTLTGNDVGIFGYLDTGPVVSISNIISGSTYAGVVVYDESQTVSGNAFVSEPIAIEAVSDTSGITATARYSCNTFTSVSTQTYREAVNGGLAFTPIGETCLETAPGVPQFPPSIPLALVTAIAFLGVALLRSKSLPKPI